jgi:hypothetical protein
VLWFLFSFGGDMIESLMNALTLTWLSNVTFLTVPFETSPPSSKSIFSNAETTVGERRRGEGQEGSEEAALDWIDFSGDMDNCLIRRLDFGSVKIFLISLFSSRDKSRRGILGVGDDDADRMLRRVNVSLVAEDDILPDCGERETMRRSVKESSLVYEEKLAWEDWEPNPRNWGIVRAFSTVVKDRSESGDRETPLEDFLYPSNDIWWTLGSGDRDTDLVENFNGEREADLSRLRANCSKDSLSDALDCEETENDGGLKFVGSKSSVFTSFRWDDRETDRCLLFVGDWETCRVSLCWVKPNSSVCNR